MPSVSSTQIVFNYGGNLWIAGRDGGDARRLTAGLGGETDPIFSPDGSMIAFTGDYSGNADVYVVPATGGQFRRLTYHPGGRSSCGLDAGWQANRIPARAINISIAFLPSR